MCRSSRNSTSLTETVSAWSVWFLKITFLKQTELDKAKFCPILLLKSGQLIANEI